MSSTSNKLSQSNRLLAEKPVTEANNIQKVLKINGNTISLKNYVLSSEELNKLISEIHNALNDHNHVIDDDDKLRLVINTIMKHCFELLERKTRSANVDSATCERNLWWIGGFRPSQLLQVILPQLKHMCTQQQLYDIYNLGQSCQQAEYALAQGMIELQQIIDKATSAGDKEYQQMYVPQHLSFFKEADNLRRQFLHQFSRLFTISQQAELIVTLKEQLHNPQPRSSL
ncbi:transcription factor bZIP protein, putative [Medicago truncatula]|uniref:Transcription factor bZIP protein, putative n=2 Tax=Medicago truncatula TaxID=3880 RepID=G7I311_MEDTR|nr:transcription factor bZIP protein, putative [Medicago truncatula]